MIKKIKEKVKRHQERKTPIGVKYVLADSIHYLNRVDWEAVSQHGSVFLSYQYLSTIEKFSPTNLQQRYAIAYQDNKPIVIIACQIAEISVSHFSKPSNPVTEKVAAGLKEKMIVCGNLVSSGLDGVAYRPNVSTDLVWRIVAESIYRIRKAEHFNGAVDFALIKDIKGDRLSESKIVERYSYRKIETDPDMVLTLEQSINTFDDYLASLTSKYRSRIRKIIRDVESSGYQCVRTTLDSKTDAIIHDLYLNVENKSSTRLATLPQGYFLALAESLGDQFECYLIKNESQIVGFVSMIYDRSQALAYYVGVDYAVNENVPIYFRLLQLVIEDGLKKGVKKISFGRTALAPKADLGAKPIESFVWARHRIPIVNWMVRPFFGHIPHDSAPERHVQKIENSEI